MGPLKCILCFQPSIEFPQEFKAVVTDFIRAFNKFYSCAAVTKLSLCKSCWIYLMRIHQLDHQLNRETRDVKFALLSSKIQRAQMSSLEGQGCKDLDVQNLITINLEEISSKDESHDVGSVPVHGCSPRTSNDGSSRSSLSASESSTEKELTEQVSSDAIVSDTESQPVRPKQLLNAYEDKWVPKNVTLPESSSCVKRLSETDFIYLNKYRFQGTELGFKCGLCPQVSLFYFYKSSNLWFNIIGHIRKWHMGNHKVRTKTNHQKCVEVAPNRYHYGAYVFEEIDGKYQCGECGSLMPKGPRNAVKTRYIQEHIIEKHRNPPRTFVCEYCGAVLKNQDSLRMHKIIKHERPSKQFPCSECGKMFVSRSIASTHHRAVHQGLYKGIKSICEICGKKFKDKVTLKDHVAFVHNGQMIECKDCGKMFASQAALYTHRHSHTGKKFTCDICGMEFTQHYSVTRHKKTAHGI